MTRFHRHAIVVLFVLVTVGRAFAQTPTAESLYADAVAKEKAVRAALDQPSPSVTLIRALRTVVSDYETIARRYPASHNSDDALWRGAMLARDGFHAFRQAREQTDAIRLLQVLPVQYPASPFAKQSAAELASLKAAKPAATIQLPEPARTPSAPPVIATAPTPVAIASDAIVQTPSPADLVAAEEIAPPAPSAPPATVAMVTPAAQPSATDNPSPAAAPAPTPAPASASARPVPLTPATIGHTKTTPAAKASPPAPAAPITSVAPAAPAANAAPGEKIATIKSIKRTISGNIVRVTIELDGDVTFRDERVENPARVYVDLPSTRPVDALKERTLRFDGDTAAVREVRVGSHPNETTRVVLDAGNVSSYTVYPLYNPPRLVIDCLQTPALVAKTTAKPAAPPPPVITPLVGLSATRIGSGVGALAVIVPGANMNMDAPIATTAAAAPSHVPATVLPNASMSPHNTVGGFSIARQLGMGVSRIVIDPGHGGHDPGTKDGDTSEADLVLDVALRLEKLLRAVPGLEIVLTRRSDTYVSLQERTAIANAENADLFLSIHANASNTPSVHGVETYFLNFAVNQSAAAVAARENAASGQNMAELPDVVKTIALNNKVDESRDFATYVQRALVNQLRPANKTLRDLGVKQAPFVVLIGASMPSVLTEISFLTNAQEARLLKSNAYRQRIAVALFDAVKNYQTSLASEPIARAR